MQAETKQSRWGWLVAILLVSLSLANGAVAQSPPNVVFILADDLGYRELGSFGQQKIRTPNLDRLAGEGMRLTQHYSGNAVCAPSRCVLMTGQHPGHAFIRDNRSTPPEGQYPIPSSLVTLGELFQQAGYVTGGFGKWGLGGPDSTGVPWDQGFDVFTGYLCQSKAHSYYPDYIWNDRTKRPLDNNPPIPGHQSLAKDANPNDPASYAMFKGTDYAPDRIHEAALDFVRQNKDTPFFLYYPSIIPHVALHVPDEELKPYHDMGWNDPPFTRERGGYTPHFTPRAAYAAMISRLDRYVGNVLNLLDELKLSDHTIVVFSSDNGTTHLGDEVDYGFFQSVGELRGLKGSLYEGGVRVPTIVRWPGIVAPGSKSDRVSGFEDWMPTLLSAVDKADLVPDSIDGVSMLPTLRGEEQPERDYLYREFNGYGGQQSIRVGQWKAVRQSINRGNLTVQLYNMIDDVGETTDVAERHPQIVKELTDMMASVRTPSSVFPLKGLDTPVKAKKRKD